MIAAEGDAAPKIIDALYALEDFKTWQFVACATYQELLEQQGTRWDVIAISRFLPGEKHPTLLRNISFMFPGSRLVLLLGEMVEEARAYEKLAQKFGLTNFVKGPLPGESYYNLPTALKRDINEGEEGVEIRILPPVEPLKEEAANQGTQGMAFEEPLVPMQLPVHRPKEQHELVTRDETPPTPIQTQTADKTRVIRIRRSIQREPELHSEAKVAPVTDVSEERNRIPLDDVPRQRQTMERIEESPFRTKGISVVVAANKGGVGKTSVLVKLASELTKVGLSVCIDDLDLHDPSMAVHYGLKEVPGIEVLSNRPVSGQLIDDLTMEIMPNLKVLPGIMDKRIDPYLEPGKVTQILDYQTRSHDVVLVDTPAQFWRKENAHLRDAFIHSSLILAVADQSSYSEASTRLYGPKILAFGGKRENIRLVLNKYDPKLHRVKDVEQYFNMGFKVKDIRVSWIIPHNWVEFVKSTYTGKAVEIDESYSQCQQLVKEIFERLGRTYSSSSKKAAKKKNGLLEGIQALCGLIKRK
ncbi:P-loop NTPase [Desulforamulus ruminis]|uniref:AAA family ATPase n=1 Tax=Desulforamulus ruminis TaxID=1564 RepID=UPI002FDAE70F